jgi:hypothetical protein
MKNYEAPKAEIITLNACDLFTESGNGDFNVKPEDEDQV